MRGRCLNALQALLIQHSHTLAHNTHTLSLSHTLSITQVSAEIEDLHPSHTRTTATITFTLRDEGGVVSTLRQRVVIPEGQGTTIVEAELRPSHPMEVRGVPVSTPDPTPALHQMTTQIAPPHPSHTHPRTPFTLSLTRPAAVEPANSRHIQTHH